MSKSGIKKKIKVLIIENSKVDRKVLQTMLSKSTYGVFEIHACETFSTATQILQKKKFDVAILDLNLPDSRGLDTLRKLNKEFPNLPIVVNTGVYQDEVGLKAITRGAQDYLIKGKYLAYGLSKALYYAIERKKAEQELAEAYEQFKETQTQLIQVEKMNVVPRSRFSRCISSMISCPVLLSRLAVGSSARTIEGSVTRARATATRCCWPPESSVGR